MYHVPYNIIMFRKIFVNLMIMAGIVCFAAIFLFIFGNSIDLKCLRTQNQGIACQINKEFLGKFPVSSRIVTNVTDVQNDENCDNDGCSYRPILVTSSGDTVPVNDVYTDGGPVSQQVSQISSFIQSDQSNFELKLNTPWWVIIMIGSFALIGLVIVFFSMINSIIKSMTGGSY